MVEWSLHLGPSFPEVVDAVCESSDFELKHSFLFRELNESQFPQEYPSAAAKLLLKVLRKLSVLFSSTMDRDFRTYTIARVSEIDTKEIDRLLYPLLKADDRPQAAAMLSAATPLLTGVLDHKREEPYLAAMATGNYRPDLLFPKHPDIVERIRLHPALLWKAQNLAERHVPDDSRPAAPQSPPASVALLRPRGRQRSS
jgi:hypothetical protein